MPCGSGIAAAMIIVGEAFLPRWILWGRHCCRDEYCGSGISAAMGIVTESHSCKVTPTEVSALTLRLQLFAVHGDTGN